MFPITPGQCCLDIGHIGSPACLSYASAPSWGCMDDPLASSGHTQKTQKKPHSSDQQPATVTHWPTLVQQNTHSTNKLYKKAHKTHNNKLSVTL